MSRLHVAVIGAGIIGLSAAYHLTRSGLRVTVVDSDPEGDKASIGNAGGIAVTEILPAAAVVTPWRVLRWMMDPLGPLAVRPIHALKMMPWLRGFAQIGSPVVVARITQALAALNSRVYKDLLPMLAETNLASELHRLGALSVYESGTGFGQDAAEWDCKRANGIEAQAISGDEARALEPALGPRVHCAVFTPQWSHVSDPKRILRGLKCWVSSHGVDIAQGCVRDVGVSPSTLSLRLGDRHIEADRVVVAAGAWSGGLARGLGDRVLLESERGYNMTIARPGIQVTRELIFAERKFVATPLHCGLRIGGAAEFGGLAAAPNFKRSRKLALLAQRYLPNLAVEDGVCWAGHRPTTPDSLPVIGPSARDERVLYAFGHGHLGLTLAATTGRLVTDLVVGASTGIDMAPYRVERFDRRQREIPR